MQASCALQVIGVGPAGISLVLALCDRVVASPGAHGPDQLLLDSLRMIESSALPGGKMPHYRINANNSAKEVVSA